MYITENFYKHYDTIDDAAIAIFFAVDHNETIDETVVEKILNLNPHLSIGVYDLTSQAIQYSKQYFNKKTTLLNRLSSNRNIRSIARNIQTSISLTAVTKIIIEEISMIISNLCQVDYRDLYTKNHIDLLIELIEDPDYLKNEFEKLVKATCQYTRVEKTNHQDKLKLLDQICKDMATYLYHYLNQQDTLAQIKEELSNHLSQL